MVTFVVVVGLLTLTPGMDTALILRTATARHLAPTPSPVLPVVAGASAYS